jgi:hypothetical protein
LKKKEKNLPPYLSAQPACWPAIFFPQRPTKPPLLFFFSVDADIWAPPVSLSPPLRFFFLTPPPGQPGAAANLAAPGRLPLFSLLAEDAN